MGRAFNCSTEPLPFGRQGDWRGGKGSGRGEGTVGSGVDHVADVTALVGVRPDVMAEAEHAFGNLFHRLRYCTQKLHSKGVEEATTLGETISELEDFLRLLLDYTSPLAVDLQHVGATAVLGSLKLAIGGAPLEVSAEAAECQLALDPGRLSEAFTLLGVCLGADASARRIEARVEDAEPSRWLMIRGAETERQRIAGGRPVVAWAVAQKLVEAQGGILSDRCEQSDGHGLQWTLRLPLYQDAG